MNLNPPTNHSNNNIKYSNQIKQVKLYSLILFSAKDMEFYRRLTCVTNKKNYQFH